MTQGQAADAQFEQASTTLDLGLKSCRTVVENYRSMLASSQIDEAATPAPLGGDGEDQAAAAARR